MKILIEGDYLTSGSSLLHSSKLNGKKLAIINRDASLASNFIVHSRSSVKSLM